MYQVIYDVNKEEYQYFNGDLIMPIILLIIMLGAILIVVNGYKTRKKRSTFGGIIFIIFLGYFLKNFSLLYLYEAKRANHLKSNVKKSHEVEGSIKNFIPLSSNRKQLCSFEINGTKFQFSPAMRTGNFDFTKHLSQNGQRVRIKYLYDDVWKMNLILKLEVLKE